MKRILALVFSLILIISLFGFNVTATTPEEEYNNYKVADDQHPTMDIMETITFSDDFCTMYFGDEKYSVFNTELLINKEYYYDRLTPYTLYNSVSYTPEQKEVVDDIKITANKKGNIVSCIVNYKNGTSFSVDLLLESYREEVENLTGDHSGIYIVDFEWPRLNQVYTKRAELLGSQVNIETTEDIFVVLSETTDKSITIEKGTVFIVDEEFYYVDRNETGISYEDISDYTSRSVPARKIEDEELIKKLDAAYQENLDDEGGVFYDDDFNYSMSVGLGSVIFFIFPLGIFVLGLVCMLRSKGKYKKLNLVTCILALSEILIFIAVVILVVVFQPK